MADLVWTSPAFLVLETLPPAIGMGLFGLAERLGDFPKMGSPLDGYSKAFAGYRQLIYRRQFRAIYEFDETENCVYILHLQDCRQRFPTARELKRVRSPDGDLPLE